MTRATAIRPTAPPGPARRKRLLPCLAPRCRKRVVGVTLAAGVITWAFSPIKFQADMGILPTFMFLWNMVGALVLIPALSHFLLNDRQVGRRAASPASGLSTVEAGHAMSA